MKKSEVLACLGKGPVLVGEFRGGDHEVMEWTDKTSGKVQSAKVYRATVELADGPRVRSVAVSVGDRGHVGEGLKRGGLCVGVISAWVAEKGVVRCRLESLEPLDG